MSELQIRPRATQAWSESTPEAEAEAKPRLGWTSTPGWRVAMVTVVLFAAGVLLVIEANRMAAAGQTSNLHYDVFWLGMALMFVPLLLWLLERRISHRRRELVCVALGVAAYVPSLVRVHSAPLFNDEIGHVEQANNLYSTGQLWGPNSVVPMARNFPGLHTLTVGIRELSGLTTFDIGIVLVLLFHVLTVMGIYVLTLRIAKDAQVAGLGAAFYAISPQFAFFDSMYAYESFAVPLAVWALVGAVSGLQAGKEERRWWFGLVAFCGACMVITHHATTYITVLLLLFLAGMDMVCHRSDRRRARGLLGVAVAIGVVAAAWEVNAHAHISTYLLVFPERGLKALGNYVRGHGSTSSDVTASGFGSGTASVHRLFVGSQLPRYEELLAYLPPLLLGVGFAFGLWRRRRSIDTAFAFVAILGSLYFLSLPFLFTNGQAGSKRSWAISFIGLAPVLAIGVGRWFRHGQNFVSVRKVLAAGVALVVLIGLYGSDVNDYQLFPGKFLLGTDGRSISPELRDVAKWFAANEGRDRYILTDIRTNEAFGLYADAQEPNYPSWLLFYPTAGPAQQYVNLLYAEKVQFIIVDDRLATQPWESGPYFNDLEPLAPSNPLPVKSLTKFRTARWLHLVHSTSHYSIYSVVVP